MDPLGSSQFENSRSKLFAGIEKLKLIGGWFRLSGAQYKWLDAFSQFYGRFSDFHISNMIIPRIFVAFQQLADARMIILIDFAELDGYYWYWLFFSKHMVVSDITGVLDKKRTITRIKIAFSVRFVFVWFDSKYSSMPDVWFSVAAGWGHAFETRRLQSIVIGSFLKSAIGMLSCRRCLTWATPQKATHCLVSLRIWIGSTCPWPIFDFAIGAQHWACGSNVFVLLTQILRKAWLV